MGTTSKRRSNLNTVMITGAGSGIGRALTTRLLEQGVTVYGGALNAAEAEAIAEFHGDIHAVIIDVTDDESIRKAIDSVTESLGERPLDALFNIAGVITNGPLLDLSPKLFETVLGVNVVGTHATTQACLPLLRRSTNARVVNMSSASGRRTLPFTGAYSASKFGVEALSTAMRLEYAPLGVHVAVIAAGLINTPMAAHIERDLRHPPSDPAYTEPLGHFLTRMRTALANGLPMARVIDLIIEAAVSAKPRARYEIHNNYLQDAVLMRIVPQPIRDTFINRALGLTKGTHP
ncbi:SDR family NAD(P)-dependent oxidoreductase [Streptomyces sp. Tue6028]|uniref:SDR family NAD(P)-dependent oxidoreductase n=1 Tax=Streptomyces sp. Tue6028 TaxID=2036037 RepID=UPI003EC012B7